MSSPLTTTAGMDAQTAQKFGVVRANDLMKFGVRNVGGENLGKVDDAVVTLPNSCLQYVLISSGGILGLGKNSYLVPWRAVALDLANGNLVLNVDQKVFDNAPKFDPGKRPDMSVANWDAEVSKFWQSVNITTPNVPAPAGQIPVTATQVLTNAANAGGNGGDAASTGGLGAGAASNSGSGNGNGANQNDILVKANPCDMSGAGAQGAGGSSGAAAGATGATGATTGTQSAGATGATTGTQGAGSTGAVTGTGATTGTQAGGHGAQVQVAATSAVMLSDLKGFKVKNSKGDELGKIEDLVIDWQHSRLAYPVMSFGGFLGFGSKWFPIPMEAVKLNPIDKTFVFDVSKELLDKAPGFDQNQLPDTTNPNWDKQIRDYWSMVNTGNPPAPNSGGSGSGGSGG